MFIVVNMAYQSQVKYKSVELVERMWHKVYKKITMKVIFSTRNNSENILNYFKDGKVVFESERTKKISDVLRHWLTLAGTLFCFYSFFCSLSKFYETFNQFPFIKTSIHVFCRSLIFTPLRLKLWSNVKKETGIF